MSSHRTRVAMHSRILTYTYISHTHTHTHNTHTRAYTKTQVDYSHVCAGAHTYGREKNLHTHTQIAHSLTVSLYRCWHVVTGKIILNDGPELGQGRGERGKGVGFRWWNATRATYNWHSIANLTVFTVTCNTLNEEENANLLIEELFCTKETRLLHR